MAYITPRLVDYEKKEFSQFNEDGVIERLAIDLGIEQGSFFEFGIGPASGSPIDSELEGNFVALRKKGWKGVFLDGGTLPPDKAVRKEFVTALNINFLFKKHYISDDLDFMSIDVDGQEFWIWMILRARPKVLVIEYNGGLEKDISITTQFDVNHVWDGTMYQGSSLLALNKLAHAKEYTLVYANGVNAIFVRDDLVSNKSDFSFDVLYKNFTPHAPDHKDRPWVTV